MKKIIRIQFILFLTLLFTSSSFAQLATWNVSTMTGGAGNFGPSPLAPTATGPNVTVTGLTRGSGVGSTTGSGAARGWGGNTWALTSAAGITGNQFITFTVSANAGFTMSLTSLNPLDYRRSGTGATNGLVQYSINGGSFVDITTLNFTVSTSGGASAGPVDLSTITALQNVASGDVVTFRVIPYGATSTSGTFYIFDFANSTASDLTINGTTAVASSCTTPGTPVCTIPAPVCEGSSVTIVGAGSLPAATTYTYWTAASGGTQILAGVTGNDLTTSNALTAGTYLFYVQGEDGTCVSAARQMVNVEILATPGAVLSGGGTTCSNVPTADMLVNFTGSGPWTFTYTDGTTPTTITATNANPYTISAAPVGNYSLVSVSNAGCAGTVSGTASIAVNTAPTIGASATQNTICEGLSTTLSGSGGINYTWMPGSLSGSPLVSPTTTTTYTVTGTDAINSCTNTSTIQIVVNPMPVIGTNTASVTTNICSGDFTNLSCTATPTYMVTWYDSPTAGTSYGTVSSVQLFNPPTNVYNFYAELSDLVTNCINPTRISAGSTNVAPLPTATITGGGTICNGGTAPSIFINLNNPGTANYQFTYTDGTNNFPVSTAISPYEIINPAVGTYTLVGTIYNGQCTGPVAGSGSVTVTTGTSPTITGLASPVSLCFGETTTLYGSGAASYTWTDNTTNPTNGVSFAPPTTSTYTVTGTATNGCTATATVAITVNTAPDPVVTHDSVCAPGGIANLLAAGTNLSWYDALTGGVLVNTGTTFSPFISTNSSYYVENSNQVFGSILPVTMPAQTGLFTGSTRGYYFTSPANIVITSLQVPTTASSANQNIAVLKFNANTPPPIFSATTNAFTVLYLTQNNSTAGNIPVNIQVYAGDVIGILASRGTTNSYSNVGNTINIAGSTVNLTRMGMQFPLATTNPQDIWSEPSAANISRVEFEYKEYISGCISTPRIPVNGVVSPLPTITASASPSTICAGSISTLSATGASTYDWMPGLLSGAPMVTPSSTQTYTVTGTDATTTCSNTSTVEVIVNPTTLGNLVSSASIGLCQMNPVNGIQTQFVNSNCEMLAKVNGTGLGNVNVCVEFVTSQSWNGEPYADRIYKITPDNNLAGNVCLYYSAADLLSAGINNNSEICITKIAGSAGLGGPGAVEEIPNAALTITSLPGGAVEICFAVTGFSSFYCHSCNPGNVPLPVSLKQFTGEIKNNSDILNWVSSTEQHLAGYNLLYSSNGADFKQIAQVPSKAVNGNSQRELSYSFTNLNTVNGHNYYALEMLDLDGQKSRHSQVLDLLHTADGQVVSLYPNPVIDQLEINLTLTKAQMSTIKLMDMSGRLIKEILVQSTQGYNHLSMDMKGVAAGMYTVQVYQNNQVIFVGKVRKQDQ